MINVFESLCSFYWGMWLSERRPSSLLDEGHSDWVKRSRHMLTSLVVYSRKNWQLDQ